MAMQEIYEAPVMKALLQLVDRSAQADIPVLLLGASGTGKEVVARRIHRLSRRADKPLIAVNCGTLHENLLLSELFGHEQGAFTGAVRMKRGLVEEADGGTLFLDEIGELPLTVQGQMLRFLQSGEFYRLGSHVLRRVNVRMIAATNRDLEKAVREKTFREDLFFRLSAMTLYVPSLKNRREDIEPLVRMFLADASIGSRTMTKITPEALDRMKQHGWPGNVRELRNSIERMKILCENDEIRLEDLPQEMQVAAPKSSGSDWPLPPPNVSLEEIERKHILNVLQHNQGNKARTAQVLGVTVKTLYNKLDRILGAKESTTAVADRETSMTLH